MKFSPCQFIAPSILAAYCAPAYAVQYISVDDAKKVIFPNAKSFSPILISLTESDIFHVKQSADAELNESNIPMWKVEAPTGEIIGYFFVDDVIGKHEKITYAVGFMPQGQIAGVEIIEYRENRGFEIRDAAWRSQFQGKSVADPLKVGQDIKNISGATMSCVHVTEGVRKLAQIVEVLHARS